MSYGDVIREGYAAICTAPSPEEAIKRYADYHHTVLGLPPLETAQIREATDPTSTMNVDELWTAKIHIPGVSNGPYNYFRGSGLVGVGSTDGRILAVSDGPKSGTDEDLVEKQYPNYRNYVPVFMGSAALMKVLGERGNYAMDVEAYRRRGEVLLHAGIIKPGQTHHLGWLLSEHRKWTAGASGVLPSPEVTAYFAREMEVGFAEDRAKGLLEWEHDAAAGFHDVVACDQAFDILDGSNYKIVDHGARNLVKYAKTRRDYGQDIH